MRNTQSPVAQDIVVDPKAQLQIVLDQNSYRAAGDFLTNEIFTKLSIEQQCQLLQETNNEGRTLGDIIVEGSSAKALLDFLGCLQRALGEVITFEMAIQTLQNTNPRIVAWQDNSVLLAYLNMVENLVSNQQTAQNAWDLICQSAPILAEHVQEPYYNDAMTKFLTFFQLALNNEATQEIGFQLLSLCGAAFIFSPHAGQVHNFWMLLEPLLKSEETKSQAQELLDKIADPIYIVDRLKVTRLKNVPNLSAYLDFLLQLLNDPDTSFGEIAKQKLFKTFKLETNSEYTFWQVFFRSDFKQRDLSVFYGPYHQRNNLLAFMNFVGKLLAKPETYELACEILLSRLMASTAYRNVSTNVPIRIYVNRIQDLWLDGLLGDKMLEDLKEKRIWLPYYNEESIRNEFYFLNAGLLYLRMMTKSKKDDLLTFLEENSDSLVNILNPAHPLGKFFWQKANGTLRSKSAIKKDSHLKKAHEKLQELDSERAAQCLAYLEYYYEIIAINSATEFLDRFTFLQNVEDLCPKDKTALSVLLFTHVQGLADWQVTTSEEALCYLDALETLLTMSTIRTRTVYELFSNMHIASGDTLGHMCASCGDEVMTQYFNILDKVHIQGLLRENHLFDLYNIQNFAGKTLFETKAAVRFSASIPDSPSAGVLRTGAADGTTSPTRFGSNRNILMSPRVRRQIELEFVGAADTDTEITTNSPPVPPTRQT